MMFENFDTTTDNGQKRFWTGLTNPSFSTLTTTAEIDSGLKWLNGNNYNSSIFYDGSGTHVIASEHLGITFSGFQQMQSGSFTDKFYYLCQINNNIAGKVTELSIFLTFLGYYTIRDVSFQVH